MVATMVRVGISLPSERISRVASANGSSAMMGVTSSGFAGIAGGLEHPPIAFGANCGTGAPDLLRTVLGITEADGEATVIAKASVRIICSRLGSMPLAQARSGFSVAVNNACQRQAIKAMTNAAPPQITARSTLPTARISATTGCRRCRA